MGQSLLVVCANGDKSQLLANLTGLMILTEPSQSPIKKPLAILFASRLELKAPCNLFLAPPEGPKWRRKNASATEGSAFLASRGQRYRGDIGVVFSDKTGTIDELRINRANSVTGQINDLLNEAKIVASTRGRFALEK